MNLTQVLALLLTMTGLCVSGRLKPVGGPPGDDGRVTPGPPARQCPAGLQGPVGIPGEVGANGYPGDPGPSGLPASSQDRPPPGTPCYCPEGPKGDDGLMGYSGAQGSSGEPGIDGPRGSKGDAGHPGNPGLPGPPGSPLSTHPPSSLGTLFVPVVISGKLPRLICHHFRRQAYVPGVPNNWLGWYESGKSGYLTYNKWLHHTSRFVCPCSVPVPPGPTPSVGEMLRRL